MTPQEAIRILEVMKSEMLLTFDHDRKEALKLAISALEKQIPKKPKVPIDTWVCPDCGRDVEYQVMLGENILFGGQYNYCPNCGQKIDWSEGEG